MKARAIILPAVALFWWCGCVLVGGAVDGERADTAELVARSVGLLAAGDCDAARKVLVEAYKGGSREVRLLTALGECDVLCGLYMDAEYHLGLALAQEGENTKALLWSSVVAAEKGGGEREKARAFLASGLEAAGDNEVELYDLAEGFLRRGALSVAAAIYEKVLSVYPTESQFDVFACLQLGAYYHLTGWDQKASEVMSRAVKPLRYGDIGVVEYQEVEYLSAVFAALAKGDSGDIEGELEGLRDAAGGYEIGLVADAFLVKALERAGRGDEAEGVWQLVRKRLENRIAQNPEDAGAYYEYALFAALSGRGAERGLKMCEWALALSPLSPEALDVKAALLLELGRYEEALRAEERAIALISGPRWGEPGGMMEGQWRRLEILKRAGRARSRLRSGAAILRGENQPACCQ